MPDLVKSVSKQKLVKNKKGVCMQKSYVYKSIALHIAVVLLCVLDFPFLKGKHNFDEQPPIIVDLENIKITDKTNIPQKAIRGKEQKQATRKEKKIVENYTKKEEKPQSKIEDAIKPEPKPELPQQEIKSPSLIEEAPKIEKNEKVEPQKESDAPKKEKKKPAPIPQKKPKVVPNKKPTPKKTPEKKKTVSNTPKTATKPTKENIKSTNPLASLMDSVDNLEKEIGDEDSPAQIPEDMPVENLGVENGNKEGSYFSELSISGIDFVRAKIQESWKTIAGGKDDRNIEVVINVRLTKEGIIESVKIEDMTRYRSDTYFQALADSAERAIYIANDVHNVFAVLSAQNSTKYSDWKEIRFTFTPLGLTK